MALSKANVKLITDRWVKSIRKDDYISSDDESSLPSLPSMNCDCCSHNILCGICDENDSPPDSHIFIASNEILESELLECCNSRCLDKIGHRDVVYEHIKK